MLTGRFNQWPWPTKFPLKKDWFHHLSRTESLAAENKQVSFFGDVLVIAVVGFSLYRFLDGRRSQRHQTRLCHLTGMPPAIIAQEFNFDDIDKNRKVERKDLDAYRKEFAGARAERASVESFIFKY
eukprot:CAMPEP_0176450264 /NCGR_PEP_ID=MMETSP0127-20121128/27035_1 /TAXON_ID=938130 /ORGANISM="Platyophrya macrostoma, Strain WH" /LENGTH=125 /DNA_ID=CAMNT_0017837891 /DNA_START=70 /DNA_END=447 /DNA_ORIENTATION=+